MAIACPRCSETLDDLRAGVHQCIRCEGLWVESAPLANVAAWPIGENAWLHNAIACPQCGTTLQARSVAGILIDECSSHGAWLDRGELARLAGVESGDLDALRARIVEAAPAMANLAGRRAQRAASDQLQQDIRAQEQAVAAARLEMEKQTEVIRARLVAERDAELRERAKESSAERLLRLEAELAKHRAVVAAAEAAIDAIVSEIARTRGES